MVGRIKAPPGFRFEQGIISITGGEKGQHLPRSTPLAPGMEQPARSKIANILYRDSLDEALSSFFRPIPQDPTLTQKGRYRQLLRLTTDELHKKARGQKDARAVCLRAADILLNLGDIQDELTMRRHHHGEE